MRGNDHSSEGLYRSTPRTTAEAVSGSSERFWGLEIRSRTTALGVLAASIYFATIGLSWGDPLAVAPNIDWSLQKLTMLARQMMPEAQVAGIHSQIAKVSAADKARTPGRWDSNDRILVHVHLDGQATLDAVAAEVAAMKGNVVSRADNYRHGI